MHNRSLPNKQKHFVWTQTKHYP